MKMFTYQIQLKDRIETQPGTFQLTIAGDELKIKDGYVELVDPGGDLLLVPMTSIGWIKKCEYDDGEPEPF